jgi:bifunctional UDP-N-acetylglucosamine pyrophosphorylase/glucosamine-1-phosphate N-acetyltransferase
MAFDVQAIILAAGKATRFNTGNTKVLEKICGQEMILYPTRLLEALKIATTVVIGHQKKVVQKIVQKVHGTKIDFVTQEEQRGTGHALLCAQPTFKKQHILIMNADVPLVDSAIIKELYERHCATNAVISFVTAHNTDPDSRYGRVIEENGKLAIVEANEFDGDYTQHCCINAGIYIAQREFLTTTLATLQETNTEIYITDLIKKASEKNLTVTTLKAAYDAVRGVNTYEELWAVEQIKRSHLIKHWMQKGVRFFAAQNVHIDLNVTIGAGTFIGAGTHLLGTTKIGKNATIDAFSYLRNAHIEDNVTVKTYCLIEDSHIKSNATVGPFAHVGPNATIGNESVIGNFVEIKNSTMGAHSKAKHLSYLGNAIIEDNVNIGAGAITCNYDGTTKHTTTIQNNAFIGTNTSLIAPVTVGAGAYTAAGSTITDDVPDNALAIARARQINKKEYAHSIRALQEEEAQETTTQAAQTTSQEQSFVGAVKTNNDITLFEE